MSGPAARPSTAVVAAGDAETRVLLRGLLRLHHVQVEGEAGGSRTASELVRRHQPALLVADVELEDGSWEDLLAEARRAVVGLRFVLVASASQPRPSATDGGSPDALLIRPFRIRAFAEAIGLASDLDPARPD